MLSEVVMRYLDLVTFVLMQGHNGVILGLAHCPSTSMIASTSDDRSAIVWSVEFANNKDSNKIEEMSTSNMIKDILPSLEEWSKAKVEAKHRVYGHVARVHRFQSFFKTAIANIFHLHRALLTGSLLYTAGEDGRVALWGVDDGQLVECQQPQVIEVDLL